MLSLKPTFSLSFNFIKRLFRTSLLLAIRLVSSACLRLLMFLPAILNPACASSSLEFHYTALTYSFTNLEPVCCSKSSTNCCFLTWIQIFQEAGKVVWYFYLFNNFPQFLVSQTVKDFGIVNKLDVDVFLELLFFQWSIGCWQFDLVSLPLWNRESKDNWAFQYSDYSDLLLKW